MSKKTVWFEVEENETLDNCLERMREQGYMAMGRKEEPVFEEIDGKPIPVKQIVKFKGVKMDN
ncbi:NETI protein [Planomicrobium soli]|uniref:NETI protein n=1 Tax=Planomicrobium soli TaxID=1176648 RepID=A0A2P8FV13_9BACL|nr:NETI motif-containing protein [Planomicrobium soli]PSL25548.1 NETI protein [Planomicrobium soli]